MYLNIWQSETLTNDTIFECMYLNISKKLSPPSSTINDTLINNEINNNNINGGCFSNNNQNSSDSPKFNYTLNNIKNKEYSHNETQQSLLKEQYQNNSIISTPVIEKPSTGGCLSTYTPSTKTPTNESCVHKETFNLYNYLKCKGPLTQFIEQQKYNIAAKPNTIEEFNLARLSILAQKVFNNKIERDRKKTKKQTQKVEKNVETTSATNEKHLLNCKPCVFFWNKGCTNGQNCSFCHEWHEPKKKKPMREQKNLMLISKADGKITYLRSNIKNK